jgi:hypothetical protein
MNSIEPLEGHSLNSDQLSKLTTRNIKRLTLHCNLTLPVFISDYYPQQYKIVLQIVVFATNTSCTTLFEGCHSRYLLFCKYQPQMVKPV